MYKKVRPSGTDVCTLRFQSNIWWHLLIKIAIWQAKTNLLMIVNAKLGSIHDAHMTLLYNTRISNGLRFILNLNTYLFVLKLTKNASFAYFYRANKQENDIWAYLCSEIYQPQLKHMLYVAVFFLSLTLWPIMGYIQTAFYELACLKN